MPLSRRSFLASASSSALLTGMGASIGLGSPLRSAAGDGGATPAAAPGIVPPALPDLFPTQAPELVRELVTVAHFSLARVRELVTRQPSLARATWDWGFGDWESALGAASHMGNREIAEFLLAHGARPDLFSAAMLGQLEAVKGLVAAAPGVQRSIQSSVQSSIQSIKGPHGITLLAHARAGGERAAPVLRYLETLGDADPKPPLQPLAEADRTALLGRYRFGAHERDVFLVDFKEKYGLSIQRADAVPRPLAHYGARAFAPAGAEAVRIRFSGESPAAMLTVHDPDLVVTARRSAA